MQCDYFPFWYYIDLKLIIHTGIQIWPVFELTVINSEFEKQKQNPNRYIRGWTSQIKSAHIEFKSFP